MASVVSMTTRAVMDLLTADPGVAGNLAAMWKDANQPVAELVAPRVVAGFAAAGVFDLAQGGKYPQVIVYCEKVRNAMTEKFNHFSGTVDMVLEVRHSQDRLEGLEERTQMYCEAVIATLDDARGDWSNGVYFTGEYEVKFEPAKHGGRNFVQVARVKVPVTVRIN